MFLIMVGLVVAGPWLTMLGSRVLAGRAGRAATLIAGRRLADNPQVAFRAVSGLMLAAYLRTACTTGYVDRYLIDRKLPPIGATCRAAAPPE